MAEGVLGEIVARKRVDVAARLDGVSIDDLRGRAKPTTRSLYTTLAKRGARFIMEVKRVSPSAGTLKQDADPAALARAYRGAADAISVLTDGPYFGGSFADLAAVRAEFDGPILCKDFVVDPRQVPEARTHGADAVLAMLSVLDDETTVEVMAEAERLDMDVLVEAHDEAEVRRAVALGARIIGINNRDLKTLTVDLAVTERLAHLVPADRLLVAESGIEDRADVARLAPYADAFLVGSSLMRAPDPAQAARALAFGRVKVCGLTDEEDVALASRAGASHGGFILVPGTPRAVDLEEAARLAAEARTHGLQPVAVFRDADVEIVAETANWMKASAVQLHGREDASFVRNLRPMLPEGCEIWLTNPVDERVETREGGDRQLFDTRVNGQSGGTGQAFDWNMIEDEHLSHAIIAGGLSPENAGAAARLGAYALDVGSGVEARPGRKDKDKIMAFFEALRLPVRAEITQC